MCPLDILLQGPWFHDRTQIPQNIPNFIIHELHWVCLNIGYLQIHGESQFPLSPNGFLEARANFQIGESVACMVGRIPINMGQS